MDAITVTAPGFVDVFSAISATPFESVFTVPDSGEKNPKDSSVKENVTTLLATEPAIELSTVALRIAGELAVIVLEDISITIDIVSSSGVEPGSSGSTISPPPLQATMKNDHKNTIKYL
ncbi:hypothetical protein KT99_10353 [Shewanella benthica KT99]|uniref:Uncharacterized protein n=1 Tax=Shewanella benthica KT99 TaxID=314608 RepID=A9EHI1_9GAMM|nr:hypothetical protein KT99_10353 [Shewanella benthica KT99]